MRSERPLVSIVVPVLDGERHLRESLDSILAQTYEPIEVIVMDDGSTDGTADIIAAYADSVAHRLQPATKGQFANVNDGIELARGSYVAVYHADDVYEPQIVASEVDYLERHPDVGAVFAADTFIDVRGRPFGRLELPPEVAGRQPLDYRAVLETFLRHRNVFLRSPSSMVRASVYRELGGYDQDRFKNTSDAEMWLRIARHHRIAVIEEHLWRYRRGHGTSSERYHALRTAPDRFFRIVDLELEGGGAALVSREALDSYEAHRAEDLLKVAASNYVLGDLPAAREALKRVSLRPVLASDHPRRARLVAFRLIMAALLVLPRTGPAAAFLRHRVSARAPARGLHASGA